MAKVIKNKNDKQDSDPGFFAQGGKTKMFGKGTSFEAKEGVSGKPTNAEGAVASETFLQGGHGKMFGKGHANMKVPGISGKASNG